MVRILVYRCIDKTLIDIIEAKSQIEAVMQVEKKYQGPEDLICEIQKITLH